MSWTCGPPRVQQGLQGRPPGPDAELWPPAPSPRLVWPRPARPSAPLPGGGARERDTANRGARHPPEATT
eukprot:684975-Pyramimonas_sp.AAC.1